MFSRFRRKGKSVEEHRETVSPPIPPDAREVYAVNGAKIVITDRYNVIEPPVPKDFDYVLRETFLKTMGIKEGDEEEKLLRAFLEVAAKRKIDESQIQDYWYHIKNTCLYIGKVTPLLTDSMIEDISCSGWNKPVYVYHSKYGYMPTNIVFTRDELDKFVHSVAHKSGFTLTLDNPVVDATLYDGSRINITISVSKEPSFTIRKAKKDPFPPTFLIQNETWPPELAALLWLAVENRCSIMFVGGTAAGKTTAMNAAAFFIPPNSKVVSIEDTYEIVLYHQNWTPLITKEGVTQLDLVKVALRQRPEYIIVGEARGLEVREMFSAMGIGHTVLTTFHGANTESVFKRLYGEPFLIKGEQLKLLDFVFTFAVVEGKRKCVAVDLVGTGDSRAIGHVFVTKILRYHSGQFVLSGLEAAFERMAEKNFVDPEEVKKDFEERVSVLKHAPTDPLKFYEFLRDFHDKE